MADPGTGKPRPLITFTSHVTVMVALIVVICVGTLVRCEEKAEVPSSPSSSFDFSDVDADGSGCVEGPEELQNFRLQVGKILGEALRLGQIEKALRAGRITHSADVNGDGRICQCDLLSILLTETTRPGVHRHAFRVYEDGSFFDDVDTDRDGVLDDVTEKQGLIQKLAQCVPDEQARTVVDAMSKLAKDDGKLTKAEYMLFLQSSPHTKDLAPQPSRPLPPPGPRPQAMPQPQPQPQSLPQAQSLPQPQALPQGILHPMPRDHSPIVNHNLETLPQKLLHTAEGGTQPDRDPGRPRKTLLPQPPQPFPGNSPPRTVQPVNSPAQSWGHAPHFQLMNEASQPLKALNLAAQSANQAGQPKQAVNQLHQSLRSITPGQESSSAGQQMTPLSAPRVDRPQPQPGIQLAMPVPQQQQTSRWLEQRFHPKLQQQRPLPDPTKLEQARPRNPTPHQPEPRPGQPNPRPGQTDPQPGQAKPQPIQTKPQPGQPQPQPGQPQPELNHQQNGIELPEERPSPQTANLNPSPVRLSSETDQPTPRPPSVKVNEEMKNLSDQLNDVKPKAQLHPPQPQSADDTLETQLQQK